MPRHKPLSGSLYPTAAQRANQAAAAVYGPLWKQLWDGMAAFRWPLVPDASRDKWDGLYAEYIAAFEAEDCVRVNELCRRLIKGLELFRTKYQA